MKHINESEILVEYLNNKAEMDKLKARNLEIENTILEKYSDVDPASDSKGTEKLETPDKRYTVVLEHKLTTTVDMEEAKKMLEYTNEKPEHYFNVKYEFSEKIKKDLSDEEKEYLGYCITQKRAKTGFRIIENTEEN